MNEIQNIPFEIVDGLELPPIYREALKPGESCSDQTGNSFTLPRFFFKIESYDMARSTMLSEHFHCSEFLLTDFREAPILQEYPKYLPVATTMLASCLELFRKKVGTVVNISANGGYRSPSHQSNGPASPHCWGTAADIYKIGNTLLNNKITIEKYSSIIKKILPGVWIRPYGEESAFSFDQLHIDLGYFNTVSERKLFNR